MEKTLLSQSKFIESYWQFRASYGTKLHYQRLALESREAWLSIDRERGDDFPDLFSPSGMLRVQPGPALSALEREILANLNRDGLRHTQFVKSDVEDSNRACRLGWQEKLLEFRKIHALTTQS